METENADLLEQLDRHLASAHQSWLLGAGISKNANIPLMGPLTERVMALADGSPHKALLDGLTSELPEGAHVEHLLSHLGDYATPADRSHNKTTRIGGTDISLPDLTGAHEHLLRLIADTIRWGYRPDTGKAGEVGNAITI
jgi:hypothetical protein